MAVAATLLSLLCQGGRGDSPLGAGEELDDEVNHVIDSFVGNVAHKQSDARGAQTLRDVGTALRCPDMLKERGIRDIIHYGRVYSSETEMSENQEQEQSEGVKESGKLQWHNLEASLCG